MKTFLDLSIEQHDKGDWHLKQDAGPCDDTGIHWVILAPEQLDTLARLAGFVPVAEIAQACERLQDRLHLLASMVEAHTSQGDPLRAAVAAIAPEHATASPMHCAPSVSPGNASAIETAIMTAPVPPSLDLFPDNSGGEQAHG